MNNVNHPDRTTKPNKNPAPDRLEPDNTTDLMVMLDQACAGDDPNIDLGELVQRIFDAQDKELTADAAHSQGHFRSHENYEHRHASAPSLESPIDQTPPTPTSPATPAAKPEPEPEPAGSPDYFPVADIREVSAITDPLSKLQALVDQLRDHKDYYVIRNEYCDLSIAANLEGKVAPAFRPQLKISDPFGSETYMDAHRDQIVIDCHWLQATGSPIDCPEDEYEALLSGGAPFNFEDAWEFANQQWRKEHRACSTLSLTVYQQSQLKALRGVEVSDRHACAMGGMTSDKRKTKGRHGAFLTGLNEWCEKNKRVAPLKHSYRQLWLVTQLLGPTASIRQITDLYALATGENRKDEKTIRDKVAKMRRNIPGA